MRSSIASGLRRTAASTWVVGLVLAGLTSTQQAFAQSPAMGSSGAGYVPADTLQPAPAVSDPRSADTALEQARRLHGEGRPDDALAALEVALETSPSDARLRFLKGVILSEQGRSDAAIEVFRGLTQDFPELPEPHNNLAALHAARGELDQARAALDEAIRALPSYALAHENLGDVHLRLAMRAWQQAAKLDAGNAAARAKLERAQTLAAAPPAAGARSATGGASAAAKDPAADGPPRTAPRDTSSAARPTRPASGTAPLPRSKIPIPREATGPLPSAGPPPAQIAPPSDRADPGAANAPSRATPPAAGTPVPVLPGNR